MPEPVPNDPRPSRSSEDSHRAAAGKTAALNPKDPVALSELWSAVLSPPTGKAALTGAAFEALSQLGLVQKIGRWKIIRPEPVPCDVSPTAHTLARAFSLLSEQSKPYVMNILISAADKTIPLDLMSLGSHVEGLRARGVADRELRKLVYTVQATTAQETPKFDSVWFLRRGRELLSDVHTRRYLMSLNPAGPGLPSDAKSWLESMDKAGGIHDLPAWPNDKSTRAQLSKEARQIFSRASAHSTSFVRLSGETMRLPGGDYESLPLFARFGMETCDGFSLLHNSSRDVPPGRGFYFHWPLAEKLFFDNIEYASALGSIASAKQKFTSTTFATLRGGYAWWGRTDEWSLPINGQNVAYCAFIPNDHLDPAFNHLYLIPREMTRCLSAARYDPLEHPEADTLDLLTSNFTGSAFSKSPGTPPILKLANISTVFGGLCQAHPYGEGDLFKWEVRSPTASNYWRDANDRVHYGWMLRQLSGERARQDWLNTFQEESRRLFNFATMALDQLDLFFHRYSAWKAGMTPGRRDPDPMLIEAMNVHRRSDTMIHSGQRPTVLCFANRDDRTESPIPFIDPVTLMTIGDSVPYRFPEYPMSLGGRDRRAWRERTEEFIGKRGEREGQYEFCFIRREYLDL